MSSIYDKIRSTLENHVASVTDVPYIAYENVSTTDKPDGVPWFKLQLFPTKRTPACLGNSIQMRYEGVFTVYVYIPEGVGPGLADELADNVISAFEAKTDISYTNPDTSETTIVTVTYADREQGITDQPYYYVPVNIDWYTYE